MEYRQMGQGGYTQRKKAEEIYEEIRILRKADAARRWGTHVYIMLENNN